MNKSIIAIAIIVIVALAIFMMPQSVPPSEVTSDEEAILEDMYVEMMNEELDQLLIEQEDFNTQTEDDIAEDLSQFYYE